MYIFSIFFNFFNNFLYLNFIYDLQFRFNELDYKPWYHHERWQEGRRYVVVRKSRQFIGYSDNAIEEVVALAYKKFIKKLKFMTKKYKFMTKKYKFIKKN
jgi:hypothetical protein